MQFKFPLAAVLRHRTHIEQEKQRELSVVLAEMQQQQNAFDELNQSIQGNMDELRKNRLTGRLDLTYLTAHRRYMLGVQRQITSMAQRLTLLQRKVDEARAALVEAAKGRKVLEKLQERQKQRWMEDQSRREWAELDDVTMRAAAWAAMGLTGETTESTP